jgi:CubicO group peptidase (beta-lactamase class C family)
MKYVLTCLTLCLITVANSQTFPLARPEDNGMSAARLERIDKMIQEHINNKWIPGAVVLVVRNGKAVYSRAYGQSDVENKIAMKKDNIFRIASQSKAITSTAVMMLYEEGKFTLDDPISRYIPEFKNPRVLGTVNWRDTTFTTTPARSEITIRQLLTHTSGIDYAGIGTQEFRAIYAKAGIPSGIGNHDMVLADKMKILGTLPLPSRRSIFIWFKSRRARVPGGSDLRDDIRSIPQDPDLPTSWDERHVFLSAKRKAFATRAAL